MNIYIVLHIRIYTYIYVCLCAHIYIYMFTYIYIALAIDPFLGPCYYFTFLFRGAIADSILNMPAAASLEFLATAQDARTARCDQTNFLS